MKKLVSLFLMLTMLVSAASMAVSAADAELIKDMASAKDGDLLYIVDFGSTGGAFTPAPNTKAAENYTYTVGDNGRSITIKGLGDKSGSYWGAPIKGLEVDETSTATITFKVKMNGTAGKNNSIGVGGWLIDDYAPDEYKFYNNYGNYNSQFPEGDTSANRAALSISREKYNGDYTTGIDAATPDADGFITCKLEFDAPNKKFRAYSLVDGKWQLDEEQTMAEANDAAKQDYLCVMFYSYYQVVDATVKDMKFFKGIGLTDAQLNYDPNAVQESTAPSTGDSTILYVGVCAAALICGVAVITKKKVR
ncbi:MAG: hypothetical protein IJ493_12825 [Clostridia bacterium]|nr:hypothetical protein [Clostridia bacterium]